MKNIPLILLLLLVFNENSKASLKNNNKKPKIIGVVSSYTENKKNSNQTSDPAYVLKERYINNLSKICQDDNVVFIVIPNDINQINKFVDIIDGLVLTGGVDIDAKYFNQKKHPKSGNDSIVRTEFEISILKKILAKKKPILGICRGIQLINVALGGDLIQDIPSYIKTDINHSYVKDGIGYMQIAHNIKISQNSLASQIINKNEIGVNSNHHQAIGRLGEGLVATGFSIGDDIIEIVELKNYPNFFLGVQWHPEFLVTKYDEDIFKTFCKSVTN